MIFFDSQSQPFAITGVSVSLNTPVLRHCSGVHLLTLGTTLDFAISDIDFSNADTFPSTLIGMSLSQFGISNTPTLNGAALTGWTDSFDNQNASWSGTYTVDVTDFIAGLFSPPQFTATPYDWVAGTTITSPGNLYLIDTMPNDSTNNALVIFEPFNFETWRVDSSGTPWDSTAFLAPTDLMQYGGQLRVQEIDFTTYEPHNGTTIINPDYSSSGAATQEYYRFYTTDGTTRSGGVLDISGFDESQFGVEIFVNVSLDGVNWYDLTSEYMGGALVNGAGCRTNSGTIQAPYFEMTLGSFTTNDASDIVPTNSIMIRISMPNTSTIRVGHAAFTWS